jgi:hypothetical protein
MYMSGIFGCINIYTSIAENSILSAGTAGMMIAVFIGSAIELSKSLDRQ